MRLVITVATTGVMSVVVTASRETDLPDLVRQGMLGKTFPNGVSQ